ncbi:hypothetical protein PENCOP_c003G07617 [Penicillium coprophilum]|uniref:Uncharacterized protein n=1 Tax=Penicillium coprophilum TaxID=36646 RepID=A0A1V6UXX1_9EURO|nr:hypothetical protein PENCOP_c003G07617 [Penicillium coprophilum]
MLLHLAVHLCQRFAKFHLLKKIVFRAVGPFPWGLHVTWEAVQTQAASLTASFASCKERMIWGELIRQKSIQTYSHQDSVAFGKPVIKDSIEDLVESNIFRSACSAIMGSNAAWRGPRGIQR